MTIDLEYKSVQLFENDPGYQKIKLDSLPAEVLCTVFEFLTIDTTKYAYPSSLDQIATVDEELYYNKVLKLHYMPLMLVNHFFHDFVKSIIFTNYHTGNDIIKCIKASGPPTSDEPFVFQQSSLGNSFTKLPRTFYEIPLNFHDDALQMIKRLWLVDGVFDFSRILGKQWSEGIVDNKIQQLVYFVFDLAVCDVCFENNALQSVPESVKDREDLPTYVIEFLTNPSEPMEKKIQIYNQQLLFNGIAKLVSYQKEKLTCKVVSHNKSFFGLSCLLWSFEKEHVSESIETLDIKHTGDNKCVENFANNLKNLTSLKNLSLTSNSEIELLSDSDIQFLLAAIKNLHSLRQLNIDIPEPPNAPCFPHSLSTLSTSTDFLSGANLIPFQTYLDHIEELIWDFKTPALHEQVTLSQNMELYKLKSLKSLTLRGRSIANEDFLRVLFDINPQITTMSIDVTLDEVYDFIRVLKEIRSLEFLNVRYFDPTPETPNNYEMNMIFNYMLCRRLPYLKVFSINALPGQIYLQNLINGIAYNCLKYTKSLETIYVYGRIDENEGHDPLTYFLSSDATKTSEMLNKIFSKAAIVLSDFIDYNYLSSKTNAMESEFNIRLTIDVRKLKEILGITKAAQFGQAKKFYIT